MISLTDPPELALDDLAGEAAVLRIYRQVFAVLAREAGAMIVDPITIDVDESILEAFAEAGSEGLTVEQTVAECRRWDAPIVRRRFDVLRDYGAISRVNNRPNELYHRAAFAPYIMLLFLRRMAEQGGQSELHQLLTLEQLNVKSANATAVVGVASVRRLTKMFRLLGNELAILAAGSTAETLGENAQLLWGNESLIDQAKDVHAVVLDRWHELDRDCAKLRVSLAAYADAIDAAAGRLIAQAGTTRALGLLPVEAWRTFGRESSPEVLAAVLDRFVFDAPAPWFSPQALIEAVEAGRQINTARVPPPRSDDAEPAPEADTGFADDVEELRTIAERLLADSDSVSIVDVLDDAGDWMSARRVLSEVTAIHHHPDLDYELAWRDGVRIEVAATPTWTSHGHFRRSIRAGGDAG
ncbi:hypothetical protein ATK36_5195 [Amycolatopsis sulphurea]|uniref:Uncharacterized protein n=1 Tax=Amycolatopsis sulphurea TaxID=76022 RepID=A0A2A9FGV1_9PSEU|nr:hypothetical protein [Amycolatopsis sulphurea]PFG49996.1 hypothetical protein ATK36_5195 [Amycolatopsis sulphurea]